MNRPFDPYSSSPLRPRLSFGGGALTPGIKIIIITCVVVFLMQALVPGQILEQIFGLSPAAFLRHFWLWQPVTYLFLHSTVTLMHLLINMLMLWMFGTELERRWGTQAFLQFYLVCGIGAGLFTVAAAPLSYLVGASPVLFSSTPTIGASGAIYGLMAAHAILFPDRIILLLFIFPMRMRPAVLLMAGLTFFNALSAPGSTISHVAHLGGMVVAWLYLRRAWNPFRMWKEWRWRSRRRKYRVITDLHDEDDARFH
ncbi:MAG: rhomboid family intramembrane serine protease [Acidobacteriota bacterium]